MLDLSIGYDFFGEVLAKSREIDTVAAYLVEFQWVGPDSRCCYTGRLDPRTWWSKRCPVKWRRL